MSKHFRWLDCSLADRVVIFFITPRGLNMRKPTTNTYLHHSLLNIYSSSAVCHSVYIYLVGYRLKGVENLFRLLF